MKHSHTPCGGAGSLGGSPRSLCRCMWSFPGPCSLWAPPLCRLWACPCVLPRVVECSFRGAPAECNAPIPQVVGLDNWAGPRAPIVAACHRFPACFAYSSPGYRGPALVQPQPCAPRPRPLASLFQVQTMVNLPPRAVLPCSVGGCRVLGVGGGCSEGGGGTFNCQPMKS